MPGVVQYANTFRPLHQSCRSSSSGLVAATPTESMPTNNIGTSSTLLSTSTPTSDALSVTTSQFLPLSKRKASVLLDDTQAQSSTSSLGKRKYSSEMSIALNKIGDGINTFNDIFRSECTQVRQNHPDTTPERRAQAIKELQHLNPPLDEPQLVAMIELFSTTSSAADTFLEIEREKHTSGLASTEVDTARLLSGVPGFPEVIFFFPLPSLAAQFVETVVAGETHSSPTERGYTKNVQKGAVFRPA